MKTRLPSFDDGVEAIVAGCDCMMPNFGIESKTKEPGVHAFSCLDFTMILVASPWRHVRVARPGRMLFQV